MQIQLVYVLRHAESLGNTGSIMQGSSEYPLSDLGRLQAASVSDSIRGLSFKFVASSPLSRALDTTNLILGRVDSVDPRLTERSAGRWEGLSRSELESSHPGSLEDDRLRPADFEAEYDVVARMQAAVQDLLHLSGPTLAVSHGSALRLLELSLGGSGQRFRHLEALVLAPGPRILGRVCFGPGFS